MSTRRAWYVACDNCGGYPAPISTESLAVARKLARGDGYVRAHGLDICPTCQGRNGYYSEHSGWIDFPVAASPTEPPTPREAE